MPDVLPDTARVVVVGGGVVGTSVAYHLAKRGWRDVVLVERKTLTSGTTWHAAGLVTLARPTQGMVDLVKHSLDIFTSLEAETGLSTGYVNTGTLHLATTDARWEELRRQASFARAGGVVVEEIDSDATVKLFPPMSGDGIVGALHYPEDGRGNATDTTMSLAKGARQLGVHIAENTEVLGVRIEAGRVTGVDSASGHIATDIVVNCTGMWAREFARASGVALPLQALHHYYVLTEDIAGLPAEMPTVKSSDEWAYVKDDAGKLMVGFFEPGSKPYASRGIPAGTEFITLEENWDHIGPFYERMIERIPLLADAGIRLFFAGPESFTPDGIYHFGPVGRVAGYWAAAGFNSVGFLTGPGAGRVLADWIVDGHPTVDLPEADPRRAMHHQASRRYLEARVTETLDLAYDMHWPALQRSSARGIRRSPLHAHVAAAGACFGEVAGWERANFYGAAGESYTYGYDRQPWFAHVAAEHRAVREDVGLFDLSSFGKLLVQGRDAEILLQQLCSGDIGVAPGRIVYTQMCNERGGIEADVTVTRWDEHRYVVMTAAATVGRDLDWIERHVAESYRVTVTDVSAGFAMLALMGPRARDLLAPLTDVDLSVSEFPFGTSREVDLGLTFARANRITFVGELGYELLIPTDQAAHVYETLLEAAPGLTHAGYHALDSLRLEKAYRSWGHDMSGSDDPVAAGLGFAVAWDKPGFLGRDALLRIREAGVPRRRLVQVLLDDPEPLLWHDEPVYRAGQLVGRLTSSGYAHSLGAAVGLGYVTGAEPVDQGWLDAEPLHVEVAGARVSAHASLRPMYDPTSARVKT